MGLTSKVLRYSVYKACKANGMFPVVICYDQIPATLTLPVTRVGIYGV